MSHESLLSKCSELLVSVNTLAAIAAKLRLVQDGTSTDTRIPSQLDAVVDLVEPGLLNGVDRAQQASVLAHISTQLRQSLDFLENPSRPPGWHHDDPVVLDSQGKSSRPIVRRIQSIAAKRPSLAAALKRPGNFLDVGTGVGWIAIEAAQTWPNMQITGIDIWEPSLELARRNIAASGMAERISIRMQSLEKLDDNNCYDLVWLPSPFIPEEVIYRSLDPIFRALAPGGTLIFALFEVPTEPIQKALASLGIVRMGGHPWQCDQIESLLTGTGYGEVEAFRFPGINLVLIAGLKPGDHLISPS